MDAADEITMSTRREQRFQRWLSQQLEVPCVLATAAAPVWSSQELPKAREQALDALAAVLLESELQYSPLMRYRAEQAPYGAGVLRRHEGKPPEAPAVLCPADPDNLRKILDKAVACGVTPIMPDRITPQTEGLSLPISFDRMTQVTVLSAPDGQVYLHRGAQWHHLADAAHAQGLAVPLGLADIFPTPAKAAEAGLLGARISEKIADMAVSYHLTLPPMGTKWHDATWLFKNSDKAEAAFRHIARHEQPLIAELIPDAALKLCDAAGIYALRKRPLTGSNFTALRVVYQGTSMQTRLNAFSASWPIESRGGVLWRKGAFVRSDQISGLLLRHGLADVTIRACADFSTLDHVCQKVGAALLKSVHETAVLPNPKPMISHHLRWVLNEMHVESRVVYLRDFEDPLGQWQAIRASGLAATVEMTAREAPRPEATEETQEWRAIREALVDEHGRLKPLADAQIEPDLRQHG